jgi:thiamine-phosphate pyrophosphorylase
MRFENTPALAVALQRAAGYARRASMDAIVPQHLLLGLMGDDEGQPAILLAGAGVPREKLREAFGLIEDAAADADPLPLAAETRRILARATDLATLHAAEGSLSTDQVLVALVEQADELRERLCALGLDASRLLEPIDTEQAALALDEPLDLRPPAEDVNAARVLDAAANRAREALRVLEDHARFVQNDAFLSGRLKQMRHDLAALLEPLAGSLLAARDTAGDVGTTIRTEREGQRESLSAVVTANARRLQEALRSLEEYGKLFGGDIGQQVERLRYDSYTLERAMLLGQTGRERLADCRLYVLATEAICRASLAGTVREACAGGAQVIQLREKTAGDRRLLEMAREVRRIAREHNVLFIVNDRPDIALLSEADGVHLGQDDMPVRDARRILGPDAIIGVSAHDLDQLRRAVLDGATYVGIGPTFPSQTKAFAALAGLDFIRQASAETSLPAFALGGITLDNIAQVLAAGATRVAVSQVVCAADDPRRVVAGLRRAVGG